LAIIGQEKIMHPRTGFVRRWLGRCVQFFVANTLGKSGNRAPACVRHRGRLRGARSPLLLEALESRTLPSAYTLSTLPFSGSNTPTPTSLAFDNNSGNLFGTTQYGGLYGDGSIIEVAKGGTSTVTLASFDGSNGSAPNSLLVDGNGNLFGATAGGGANSDGTLFEVMHGTTTITTLASFAGSDGSAPSGLVLDGSNDLFGTTTSGGANNEGTIFELVGESGMIKNLASFDDANANTGSSPSGPLVLDGGNLFGTAQYGGANNDGTLFELANGSSSISVVAPFDSTNGQAPTTGLVADSHGNMYGATNGGGANGEGAIFEVKHGSTSITTLASFPPPPAGIAPYDIQGGLVVDGSGDIFGVTAQRPDPSGFYRPLHDGIFFEVVAGSGKLTTLSIFNNSTGVAPATGLVADQGGNIFGATAYGGATGTGAVFKVAHGATTPAPVASLPGNDGEAPAGDLVLDASGDLFGVSSSSDNNGAVWEVAQGSGLINNLAAFDSSTTGYDPLGGVVRDANGNLFGTTDSGGANFNGTIFEVAAGSSSITTLASFDSSTTGEDPVGGLVLDANGNLFGTTEFGGPGGHGTLFELAHHGTAITVLASFNGTNGSEPQASLILDGQGDLFGTTEYGGAGGNNMGTVFELPAGGHSIDTLFSFDGANGAYPLGRLLLDNSGDLLGTTSAGGSANDGTVFELAPKATNVTVLASFTGANGSAPGGGLIQYSAGDLFGTTTSGGDSGNGTVFELPQGTGPITTLTSFDNVDANQAVANLVMDTNGDLFGITSAGGNFNGTVFELAPTTPTQLVFTQQPSNVVAGATMSTVTVQVQNAAGQLVTGYPLTITLSINTGPSGGALQGTFTAGTHDGVATFANLALDTLGTYTLSASGGSLGSLPSNSFSVSRNQAVTSLATFDGIQSWEPNALIVDSAGNLFGTTQYGGANNDGMVFEIPAASSTIITLASFTSYSNGINPKAGLVEDSAGDLFGTTSAGGTNGEGTVFEVVAGSGTATTLASFQTTWNHNGSSLVLDKNGDLFGVTINGGANNDGDFYELAAHNGTYSGTLTSVAPFTSATTGSGPTGLVIDKNGNLYGTTTAGGANNDGTVFELPVGGTTIMPLAPFTGTSAPMPSGSLTLDTGGDLFGVTTDGGANNDGSVFELASNGITINTLASFDYNTGPWEPQGTLAIDAGGDLFGVTAGDGGIGGQGTLFELLHNHTTVNTLAILTGLISLGGPGVVRDGTGNLFGVTPFAGTFTLGGVFELPNGAGTANIQASFGSSNGANPNSDLIAAGNGDLVGTTVAGGDSTSEGTVYEVNPASGATTTLAEFNQNNFSGNTYIGNGVGAPAGVTIDGNGNLFGSASLFGDNNLGGLFEIASNATGYSVLASFTDASGYQPYSAPTLDGNGDLFGTAYSGGANGDGTVYELAQGDTTITPVVSFDGTDNGANPYGGLVMDTSGDLFGTTEDGGLNGVGTVFEILHGTTAITPLATFDTTNGANPDCGLVLDGNGDVFGTTFRGGADGGGTVFEVLKNSGQVTVLASLDAATGTNPLGTLYRDSAGNLFGTAENGGANNDGTVFEVVAGSGVATVLTSFTGADGANPEAGLVPDGTIGLIGTTYAGGAVGLGTVFEVSPVTQLAFVPVPASAQTGVPISPSIQVEVMDAAGHVAANDTSYVTLSIATGPAGGTLLGTVTERAQNGVATFPDLALDTVGAYTLMASDGSLLSATSGTIHVTPVPSSTITFPTASAYGPVTWTGTITGTAMDTSGAGLASVSVSIFNGTDYWKGADAAFDSATPVFNQSVLSGTSWSYALPAGKLVNGTTYTVKSQAIDNDNDVEVPKAGQAFLYDTVAPTSSVNALPAHSGASFTVSWAGQDNTGGSGIAGYDVFYTDNGGTVQTLVTDTPLTSYSFTGQAGHTYSFYSVAIDNAGNRQPTPTGPFPSTTVGLPPQFTSAATIGFAVGVPSNPFTVTASGFPAPAITESSTDKLPAGVGFVGGVLSGTPAAGTIDTYVLHFTAHNGVSPDATQTFTLYVGQSPAFTSVNSYTFTVGTHGSFTVKASGSPKPSLSEDPSDQLPPGIKFNSATGVLSGTPTGAGNTYNLHFTAHNGIGSDAMQSFTLTVHQRVAFTSASRTTFVAGGSGSFPVAAAGYPAATVTESSTDKLPPGVSFTNGVLTNATAAGPGGVYTLHFIAQNSIGSVSRQTFTLIITPLALTLLAPSPTEGAALSNVLVGKFTDVANTSNTVYLAKVSWGDGQISSTTTHNVTIQPDAGTPGVFDILATKPKPYSHAAKNLTFTVTVTDKNVKATETESAFIDVAS